MREPTRFPRCCGLVVLLVLAGCTVNPATGSRQFNLVSESREIALGRESDPAIVAQYGLYDDEDLAKYVDGLGQSLAALSERPDLPWTFRVLDDPIVNAFALPGGYVYVTRGILAHLGSEAELVGVLGHEIGHITARHGASQMSKGLLAQAGLGVAAALDSPFLENTLGYAQTGIGLLFLKHGRDDERQADHLGVRYALLDEYDPRSLAGVFETLGRVSEASSAERMPGWMSTHPSPGNRQDLLAAEIERLGIRAAADLKVRRESYLRGLDGLVVGENPREGYFKGALYVHPELRFRIRFPESWKGLNLKQSVSATSPKGDAVVQLGPAEAESVAAAVEAFFAADSIEKGDSRTPRPAVNAVSHSFKVERPEGNLAGLATFVEHDELILSIVGYCLEANYSTYADRFRETSDSFGAFRANESDDSQPLRLRLSKLPRSTTLREWYEPNAGPFTVERLALLNNVGLDVTLAAGRVLKTVEGKLPGS